ncbi:pali-domain-containing protein [Pluteus cervinus]|uniref:Pali-domain-containing protein n=1 Tax=Pluteus cervinus TaxID=181527 RepID=A0ACD3BIK9_9AGAR|nr:pali-domain-containing protein [Pluteus cervinus]
MGCIRPATPGFLVTLVATGLLAVVSFCVPYFKSVFFLKAVINVNNVTGAITFGTLGYCIEVGGSITCSKPTIGYELDINALVGNKLPIEIPQVVVKWLTYALALHIVALVLAAAASVFGLLAHVREMSMTCCSTFVSGFAAGIALLAFIFDIALFFIAKARINAVGSAQIGSAIWMTLAAWVLLFFSGCFYTIGRCCISSRKPKSDWEGRRDNEAPPYKSGTGGSSGSYIGAGKDGHEELRMDAIRTEAERKAAQKYAKSETGLPPLHEIQPLTARIEGDNVYLDTPYQDQVQRPGNGYPAGYAQAPIGTRTVDDYYQQNTAPAAYHPQRQNSGYATSQYAPTTYHEPIGPARTLSPQQSNGYLAPGTQQPYYGTGREYGHTAAGTSYHTASSHGQQPSSLSQYDAAPYDSHTQYQQPQHYQQPSTFNPDTYNQTAALSPSHSPSPPLGGQQAYAQHQPERSYTLGGDGYGGNAVPALPDHQQSYYPYPGDTQPQAASSIDYGIAHSDAPPGYEKGTSAVQGHWGKH